jgi:hypothetical protein
MARAIGWLAVSASIFMGLAGTAAAQATVEYGLGAARAATTTAPAAGLGKAMSGLAGSLDKALKGGQPDSDTRTASKTTSVPSTRPANPADTASAATKFEDPGGIDAGLSYADVVRRFGPPNLEISGETGKTLTYSTKSGSFHVDVEDDKVTSVRKPKS